MSKAKEQQDNGRDLLNIGEAYRWAGRQSSQQAGRSTGLQTGNRSRKQKTKAKQQTKGNQSELTKAQRIWAACSEWLKRR